VFCVATVVRLYILYCEWYVYIFCNVIGVVVRVLYCHGGTCTLLFCDSGTCTLLYCDSGTCTSFVL
jgi:hypothetical protein